MSRVNVPDLAFGLFLVAIGAIAFYLISDLPMGSTARMGPGYVPRALAAAIMLFGLVLGGKALVGAHVSLPEIAWRPILFVGAAVGLFALLLPKVGLAITSVVVVAVASFASSDARIRETVILALVLAAFAVGLFILALGLPFSIWPAL
jgi:hypothetical protein